MKLNNFCKLNGFTGSGEVADLLGLYSFELSKLMDEAPLEFFQKIAQAKVKKGIPVTSEDLKLIYEAAAVTDARTDIPDPDEPTDYGSKTHGH